MAPGLNVVTIGFDEEDQAKLFLTAGTSIATPLVSGMLGTLISFLKTMGVSQAEARASALNALKESASIPAYVEADQKIRWGSAGLPDLLLAVSILRQKYGFEPTPTPFPTTPPEEPTHAPTATPIPQPTVTPTPQPTSQPTPKEWRLHLPLIKNEGTPEQLVDEVSILQLLILQAVQPQTKAKKRKLKSSRRIRK